MRRHKGKVAHKVVSDIKEDTLNAKAFSQIT